MVEQEAVNFEVVSSSLTGGATMKNSDPKGLFFIILPLLSYIKTLYNSVKLKTINNLTFFSLSIQVIL